MSEYIVDTNHTPHGWNLREFAEADVTRCSECMWYEDGWCHVWEAETLPDGWCYQGAESDEDYRELIEEVLHVGAVA